MVGVEEEDSETQEGCPFEEHTGGEAEEHAEQEQTKEGVMSIECFEVVLQSIEASHMYNPVFLYSINARSTTSLHLITLL
jgi:hypothetical protein